jgi:type VI secretion system protein VasI
MSRKKLLWAIGLTILVLWGLGRLLSSSSHVASTPETGPTASDKWRVTESRSPMDDSKTVVLSLDSEDLIQGPIGSVKPTLIVRCQEKKTAVYVVTGMAARIEEDVDGGPSDYHKVRLRIDDGVASPESWTEATDHRALFASDEVYDTNGHYAGTGGRIGFAKRLAGATTLIFEFTPFDGSPQTARFNLRGLDTHLDKVAEACSWPIQ